MDQGQTPHSTTGQSHSPSSSASGSTSTEPVRSRWSPKPEQILILESIFNSGMVNPPKEETVRIRKMLEKFGKVGDANVFYWFQNRRSRSRRRQRQLQAAAAAATTTTNTCDQTMMVSNNLPQHSGSDLGFGGCSTSNYLFASSSSYGAGCDNHSNNGMENLLTMSGEMGYHEANQHHYNYHSSNVESILCPSEQSSNYHYQQGSIMGWHSTLEGFAGLLGARNVRASLSPLHAEMEALLWAMECMRNLRQSQVTFATDCSQLVKMVSEPEEWPAFASYLEDIKRLRASFLQSEIVHVPRAQNTKADSLARSVRIQPSFVVHMDQYLPAWFTESI